MKLIFNPQLIPEIRLILFLLFAVHHSTSSVAQAQSPHISHPVELARIYRNPEERREAGLKTQLTEWLKLSGLIETESTYLNQHFTNRRETSKIETPSISLQLAVELGYTDALSAELILETEHDGQRFSVDLDEGFINAEINQWGIKVGRQYLTFGEYYSHFVTGPMLDFGETRGTALIIDYSLIELFEISTFIFASDVGYQRNHTGIDWGINLDYTSSDEALRLGIGYLSDLSESHENFISGSKYLHRVSAWNAYFLFGFNQFEITAEMVQAIGMFKELDKQNDKPFAFNLELAYLLFPSTQLALRLEHSDEFSGHPAWQYGIASSWRPTNRCNISLEYLYGHFRKKFAFDDNDNELNNRHILALQLSFEF